MKTGGTSKMSIKIAGIAIFLTFFYGCALLSFDPDDESGDYPEISSTRHGQPSYSTEPSRETASHSPASGPDRPTRYLPPSFDSEVQKALESEELILGMRTQDVLSIWGKPQRIESAGDPKMGNQKWSYSNSVLRQWNSQPSKVIYFESGKVVGWENTSR
jgi:hypothetical protein